MSRYNHFSEQIYSSINFGQLMVGDMFRMDKFNGNRRRKDVIMVKTSRFSYEELKSKKEYNTISSNFNVSVYQNQQP